MIGIYMILNTINNKKYIGQTHFLKSRFLQHKYYLVRNTHNNPHLQSAWNKYISLYNEKVFVYSILEQCSSEELNNREDYWVEFYDTLNSDKGYNIRQAGSNGKLSNETKLKIGKKVSGELNGNYGKHWNGETLQKMKDAKKGDKNPMYGRKGLLKPCFNKPLSKEHCLKLKKAIEGKRLGENHPMFGKKHSKESKNKTSITQKNKHFQKIKSFENELSNIINLIENGYSLTNISKGYHININTLKSILEYFNIDITKIYHPNNQYLFSDIEIDNIINL